ncbi:MAG: hypothetical protein Q9226_005556 [Calogaya cf. arnoldii]
MPSANNILFLVFTVLLPVWALPTHPSKLSISVRDIVKNNLSAHEADPNFVLYTRWLETPQGSYIRSDPKAAFTKHPNVVTIDCHSDLSTCLLTSQLTFADITKSKRELDNLNSALEEQLHARDEEDPAASFARVVDKYSGIAKRSGLEKRGLQAKDLYSSTHLKTYHDLGEDMPAGGFQHYIVWDLKCQTLQFTSNGFQLTNHGVTVQHSNTVVAQLHATLVGDQDPASTHSVSIVITFMCGIFINKCCVYKVDTHNYIGGNQVVTPKTERIECTGAKDVSKQNCETAHGGWCGVHITQYQRNQGPGLNTENYRFDVILYDGDQELIAELELLSIPSGQSQQVGSPLPYTFGVTAPNLDDDAVYMSYNGQSWGSNDQDHHCNFGAYDGGKRDGDSGFSC